jgi:hypothetical protein
MTISRQGDLHLVQWDDISFAFKRVGTGIR